MNVLDRQNSIEHLLPNEIEKRSFVLVPMAQIAPWLRHPVSKSTIKELLEQLEASQKQD